jgi:hypothetical protein
LPNRPDLIALGTSRSRQDAGAAREWSVKVGRPTGPGPLDQVPRPEPPGEIDMADLGFIALIVILFGIALLVTKGVERL